MSQSASAGLVREYAILAVLGQGGFGKVYLARDRLAGEVERYAALKLLRIDAPQAYQERFRDEAAILSLLDHPSFVKVHALFRVDGRWCIDMEYVRGVTLHRLLERGEPVPPAPALEMVRQVAQALDIAWNQPGPTGEPLRVLHRDIKPSNLMVTRAGIVKVLDFGIARWQAAPRRATPTESRLPASLGYMAPERQGFKSDFGPEADIYALGVILWELLVAAPFVESAALQEHPRATAEVADPYLTDPADRLDGLRLPTVVALVRRMLAREPARRPTAAEVARICSEILAELRDVAGWRSWLDEVARIIDRGAPGGERDGLCGRIVRSDPVETLAGAGPGTFLPLTGVTDATLPEVGGAHWPPLTRRPAGRRWGLVAVLGASLLGLGVLATGLLADADGDGARAWADCDDHQAARAPELTERCDGLDNDCDSQIDEDLPQYILYADADGDGVGVGVGQRGCSPAGSGSTQKDGDCDDRDPKISPAEVEIPGDGLDNDCQPATPDRPDPAPADRTKPARPAVAPTVLPTPAAQSAPEEPRGAVRLLGSSVTADIYDRAGAQVAHLIADHGAELPPGSYTARVHSELSAAFELGPFEIGAGARVILDCSVGYMGQLCALR